MERPNINVELPGMRLKNPVIAASGTFGFGTEYDGIYPAHLFGAIILKGTTLKPRDGNPPPRIYETPSGLINSVGLQNPGIESVYDEYLPKLQNLRESGTKVILNIAGDTVDEYEAIASICEERGMIDGIEVNLSCPNVKKGGVNFGSNPDIASKVVASVRRKTTLPVIVKLAPVVTDIGKIALSCQEAGADAISAINTLPAVVIDIDKQKLFLGGGSGGLSGSVIKPFALMQVMNIVKRVSIPVIGCGGIMNSRDAIEFIMVGARAVQIGTGLFVSLKTVENVINGLVEYLSSVRKDNISQIEGIIFNNGARSF